MSPREVRAAACESKLASSAAREELRTTQCSGLAIESSGVDSPAVASR